MKSVPCFDLKALRIQLGLNQRQFWGRLGVTQSCGSRYEAGRQLPQAMLVLVNLLYVEKIDPAGLKGEDVQVMEFLKKAHPRQFADLKKEMRRSVKTPGLHLP